MGNLKIEYLQISDLTPYEKNARKHQDADVQTIVASIKEFGFDDPIGVWGEDNLIVEGHGRLMAAKKLGMETVPVIHLDHLTDEQRRAYALAHNKTAEMSEWDFDLLDDELDKLSQDFDMSEFGFDLGEDFSPDDFGEDFSLPDGDKPEICTMTFTLHTKQKELIEYAMSIVSDNSETFGNTNKNGNALYEIVRQWAEQKK